MSTSSAASRVRANIKELFQANLAPGEPFIRFQLSSEMTALLSMEQVQESLIVDVEQITPLPSMPESVIGIISSRNHVFCVFNLARFLKLPSGLITPRQYKIIVLQTISEPSIYVGLAVTSLQGIVRLPTEQIQSSLAAFPDNITPYLCGAVLKEEKMMPVFEFNRISEALSYVS